ncbi:MAG: hypothetical protein PHG00_05775 [Methylococcales bacterium]|nr:hypothetical protein [Methylococcales bacterium]
MSFKSSLIKTVIKWTPNTLIIWVANIILKGIGELKDFNFDLEARKAYTQLQLAGESETIEVWFEDFAIVSDEESYRLIVQKAQSNRLWLDNLLSRIVGKEWKIPVTAEIRPQVELIAELLKPESPKRENN